MSPIAVVWCVSRLLKVNGHRRKLNVLSGVQDRGDDSIPFPNVLSVLSFIVCQGSLNGSRLATFPGNQHELDLRYEVKRVQHV